MNKNKWRAPEHPDDDVPDAIRYVSDDKMVVILQLQVRKYVPFCSLNVFYGLIVSFVKLMAKMKFYF